MPMQIIICHALGGFIFCSSWPPRESNSITDIASTARLNVLVVNFPFRVFALKLNKYRGNLSHGFLGRRESLIKSN
ncbi:hypothetical protein C8Q69DRAFT_162998 [Paecilomyces variotii]|uniref:Uncharacterized protein n=1 Tax=Byssochlamys spectabilis TaxID=264951 RepID=A0A443I2D2_BYSSP|nr:hypothetical protein C8Q69DRAFT_162998 [Paecilomyces variotii]RWQ98207.1 hypothetical protein C8Q69DRAFT_162998 [Paecilomyces variotii]